LNLTPCQTNNYFRALSSRIKYCSQTTLPREGYLTYYGSWWGGGSWNLTGTLSRDSRCCRMPPAAFRWPYGRAPACAVRRQADAGPALISISPVKLSISATRHVLGYAAPSNPSLSLPHFRRRLLHPENRNPLRRTMRSDPTATFPAHCGNVAVHGHLGDAGAHSADPQCRGGLIYERAANWQGQKLIRPSSQAYYLFVPHRRPAPDSVV